MRYRKLLSVLLAGAIAVTSLTGCSTQRRTEEVVEDDVVFTNEPVSDIKDLENGCFYIEHDGQYQKLYAGNANFNISSSISTNGSCTLWFQDDFEYIPTMYDGDMLVYYTTDPINEKFSIDRFEYMGYTVGISRFKELSSGRYSFDATAENGYINPTSNAYQLTELNSNSVILESIGGSSLRSGNISRGGMIIGLKPNASYATDVYVGTELHSYSLCADSIALTAMESFTTNDYTFLGSTIAKINLVEWFNNGYYMINNAGIFRYVKGTSYDEYTDFNVPNVQEEDDTEEDVTEKQLNEQENVTEEIPFVIQKETDATITVEYQKPENINYEMADPIVKVVGSSQAYTLQGGDGMFRGTIHLTAGEYKLVIIGLNGRAYEYSVTGKDKQ